MNWSMIASVEAVIIITLLLLILSRKIGRPLSDAEVQQKINRKKQKEDQKKERQQQRQLEWQKKLDEISAQEREIKNMLRPVTFVSLSGDNTEGRTLCVQDGNGAVYTLHCYDYDLEIAPLFNGLYNASIEPHYYSKIGAVLLK